MKVKNRVLWSVYILVVLIWGAIMFFGYTAFTKSAYVCGLKTYKETLTYTVTQIKQKTDIDGTAKTTVWFESHIVTNRMPHELLYWHKPFTVTFSALPKEVKQGTDWDVETTMYYNQDFDYEEDKGDQPVVTHKFMYLNDNLSTAELNVLRNKSADDLRRAQDVMWMLLIGVSSGILVLAGIILGAMTSSTKKKVSEECS